MIDLRTSHPRANFELDPGYPVQACKCALVGAFNELLLIEPKEPQPPHPHLNRLGLG